VDGVGTTRYSYDAAGQLLSEDGPWGDDAVSYSYANRLRTGLSVQQPNAAAWSQSYAYDALRRLTNITSPAGAFGYSYDAGPASSPASLVRKLTLPNGAYITNEFDSVARLTSTVLYNSQDVHLNVHTYSYDLASQRTRQAFQAGNYVDYTYDPIGQLKTAFGTESNGITSRLQERLSYAYDPAGNLNWRTNNGLVQGFTVNTLNELTNISRTAGSTLTVAGSTIGVATNVTVNSSNAALYADGTFAYAGLTLLNGTNTFTAIARDAYGRTDSHTVTSYLPASTQCQYDANGNLVGDGRRSFAYDDENQLVLVIVTNASGPVTRSDFACDGLGRRRIRTESSLSGGTWATNLIVCYVYDGLLVLQERHYNPQISMTVAQDVVSYTRGLDLSGTLQRAGGIGGLLARSSSASYSGSDATAFYHADGSGNVTCLLNSNQVVVARYHYDPFGSVQSQSGSLAESNLYRFSSKEVHPGSGLSYYLYRYYDSITQRWLTRDPLSEGYGLNQFRAFSNNPISCVDFAGLSWGSVLVAFGSGVAVGFVTAAIVASVAIAAAAIIPVAAVTGALYVAAMVGTAAVSWDIGSNAWNGNWDAVAYDVGTLGGGALFGGMGGGRLMVEGITGTPSKVPLSRDPFATEVDFSFTRHEELPFVEDVWNYLGTGPTPKTAVWPTMITGAEVDIEFQGLCLRHSEY
jgi:RHS repeat-associated protein